MNVGVGVTGIHEREQRMYDTQSQCPIDLSTGRLPDRFSTSNSNTVLLDEALLTSILHVPLV